MKGTKTSEVVTSVLRDFVCISTSLSLSLSLLSLLFPSYHDMAPLSLSLSLSLALSSMHLTLFPAVLPSKQAMLKKPDSKNMSKRNALRPFEDQSSVEFLCRVNDSSLFGFATHSKKRPHTFVMGRCFDFQVLDMIEFGINASTFKSLDSFAGRKVEARVGSKPCFVFEGDEFDTEEDMKVAQNLILDYFRGEKIDHVNLAGLNRVFVCTAVNGVIYFRHYGVLLKRSGTRFPRVELEEIGPRMDMTIRRRKEAAREVKKLAYRVPRELKPKKVKNIEKGQFGNKMGRVHMERQDLEEMALRKFKALKKKRKASSSDEPGKKQMKN